MSPAPPSTADDIYSQLTELHDRMDVIQSELSVRAHPVTPPATPTATPTAYIGWGSIWVVVCCTSLLYVSTTFLSDVCVGSGLY
jgi:hypothetical protein